jgi:hypothetical protein
MARRLRCLATQELGGVEHARHLALSALATGITDDDLQARQLLRADRNGARRWPKSGEHGAEGIGPQAGSDRTGALVVRLRTPR